MSHLKYRIWHCGTVDKTLFPTRLHSTEELDVCNVIYQRDYCHGKRQWTLLQSFFIPWKIDVVATGYLLKSRSNRTELKLTNTSSWTPSPHHCPVGVKHWMWPSVCWGAHRKLSGNTGKHFVIQLSRPEIKRHGTTESWQRETFMRKKEIYHQKEKNDGGIVDLAAHSKR